MRYLVITLVIGFMVTDCAHTPREGSVDTKISDQEARVVLGEGEVKEGDKVNLFRYNCNKMSGIMGTRCHKIKLGEGTVTKIFDAHNSLVKVDSGVSFAKGNVVEKK